jgi:hypothetical protein
LKINYRVFFLIITIICVLVLLDCGGIINDGINHDNFINGKYISDSVHFDSAHWPDKDYQIRDDSYKIMYNFIENANIAEISIIDNDSIQGSYYIEYELSKGKYRERLIYENIDLDGYHSHEEWGGWLNYTVNNDIFELEIQPNIDVYFIYIRK